MILCYVCIVYFLDSRTTLVEAVKYRDKNYMYVYEMD